MLHRDLLLAAGAVALERFHLGRESSRELVEGAFRAVLLRNVVDVVQLGHLRLPNNNQISGKPSFVDRPGVVTTRM